MLERSEITLVLGPTNTGKTHRAIERMLDHESGMMGLPLRLLAREVYDRVTARVGEDRVALVTGEEKRVPRRPAYWVCTVEAMPMDREVDFLAVDEVQLAESPERGHVFTDRILHARGRKETWFLGSHTMRRILGELVPTAKVAEFPRLSSLRFADGDRLARLPKRSALVAFSMHDVYEAAERLRATQGGAAVVLGALSPRTRNAQVAMFEAGDVDYVVATDAIGMGLNLDVRHVAFRALRKFDGREERELELSEIAQIAGRAGRYVRDGTFGTLLPVRMPRSVAQAVEAHVLPDVRRLTYRSSDLDFSSLAALQASLRAPPPRPFLVPLRDAEDAAVLDRLAAMPEVRARVHGEERLRLLWDIAQIPDYRKLLLESHVELARRLFAALSEGPIRDEVFARFVAHLAETDFDEETLVARIADTRTWTYVAHRNGWVENAEEWRAKTRAIEDRLSDALHTRLVGRFVDTSRRRGKPRNLGGSFQALAKLLVDDDSVRGDPVERIVAATRNDLSVDDAGYVLLQPDGERIGKLTRGATIDKPNARYLGEVTGGGRVRIERRLLAFARDLAEDLLGPLRAAVRRAPELRGIGYFLEQGLGACRAVDVAQVLAALSAEGRAALAEADFEWGRVVAVLPETLTPDAMQLRRILVEAYLERTIPPLGLTAPAKSVQDARIACALGYPLFGPRAIRADIAEEALGPALEGEPVSDDALALLGVSASELSAMVDVARDGDREPDDD